MVDGVVRLIKDGFEVRISSRREEYMGDFEGRVWEEDSREIRGWVVEGGEFYWGVVWGV